ncbi:MAG: SDR family NAD(P)-dependent oxidoreductase, partial [Candidatus Bathyarchaeia archaeon]
MKLKGRVAIVTGAGKGIGKAVALTLSEEGATVIVSDIDEESMKNTASQIDSHGGEVVAIRADVSSKTDVKNLFEKVVERFGRVDILVNSAGIFSRTPILEMSEEEWDKVLDVNLKGTFFCCQEALPIMFKQKTGKIINIASLAGKRGGVTSGINYSSSKAGVMALTRSLAKFSAPHNVIVNAVAPGIIDTDMIKAYPPELKEKQIQDIPLKRLGTAEEVAK